MRASDIIIQANSSQFRKAKETLHILPYYVVDEETNPFEDPQGLLETDQREQW